MYEAHTMEFWQVCDSSSKGFWLFCDDALWHKSDIKNGKNNVLLWIVYDCKTESTKIMAPCHLLSKKLGLVDGEIILFYQNILAKLNINGVGGFWELSFTVRNPLVCPPPSPTTSTLTVALYCHGIIAPVKVCGGGGEEAPRNSDGKKVYQNPHIAISFHCQNPFHYFYHF